MEIVSALGSVLRTAFDMFWEVLWPLVLGFGRTQRWSMARVARV